MASADKYFNLLALSTILRIPYQLLGLGVVGVQLEHSFGVLYCLLPVLGLKCLLARAEEVFNLRLPYADGDISFQLFGFHVVGFHGQD
ncbi:MAG: hypothetical protein IJS08_14720, partial [Victivallales bacterium]|nr:hypothetical protein [Victivallales bacterium]